MEKVHLIGWAFLIMLLTAGATLRVLTPQEAIDAFQKGASIGFSKGIVESCEKEATSVLDVSSKDFTVKYAVVYTLNGENKVERGSFEAMDCEESTIKTLSATEFEKTRTRLTNEYKAPEKIIIGKAGSPISQFYDMATKAWK